MFARGDKQQRCVHVGLCGIPCTPRNTASPPFPITNPRETSGRAGMASIIADRYRSTGKSRDGTDGLTNGSQPRDINRINLHSCFATEATQNQGARRRQNIPDGKESMDTSSDVSPGDSRRKKAERGRSGEN